MGDIGAGGRELTVQNELDFESDLIFPLERRHNHASCVVELPNGDLLVCWYRGSGEREADDVEILGARLRAGAEDWSRPFLMADTPGYPDCNPCMFLDGVNRLWLVYVTILANEWHTALLKSRSSHAYRLGIAPRWDSSEVLHVTPGEEFVAAVNAACDAEEARLGEITGDHRHISTYLSARRVHAGDKLYRRLGWMPRAHATLLSDGRLVLPLYSDGFHFSIMLLSDSHGLEWHASMPLVSLGGIQPSVVERRGGTLVAYMRDNGPPPKRVMISESHDRGETWTTPLDTDIPNPGSGLEAIRLASGRWLMVCNDTESGRHRLSLLVSDDEGRTWKRARCLEDDATATGAGWHSYPSVIQSHDGSIHVTYSYHLSGSEKSIKWAHFSEAWLLSSP